MYDKEFNMSRNLESHHENYISNLNKFQKKIQSCTEGTFSKSRKSTR